jgi:hypothetical protein
MAARMGILKYLADRNNRKRYKPTYSMAEDKILHIVNQDRDER